MSPASLDTTNFDICIPIVRHHTVTFIKQQRITILLTSNTRRVPLKLQNCVL